jgi:serine/threonine-protein phosphatase Stp1
MSNEPRLLQDFNSHQGCVRSANEDSIACLPRERVWTVADGMGGHKNGQYASRKVASAIEAATIPEDLDCACEAVIGAIVAANDALFAESQASREQMGSTVVSLVIRQRRFAVLWVGDSRAYLYRGGALHQLTRDHTHVQEMVDRGLIDKAAAENHPMSHMLARAIGVQAEVRVDAFQDATEIDDIFVICSDGLHGVLSDIEISEIISKLGRHSAEKLVEACLARGAPDNVTVAIVRVIEPTTLAFAGNQEAT